MGAEIANHFQSFQALVVGRFAICVSHASQKDSAYGNMEKMAPIFLKCLATDAVSVVNNFLEGSVSTMTTVRAKSEGFFVIDVIRA